MNKNYQNNKFKLISVILFTIFYELKNACKSTYTMTWKVSIDYFKNTMMSFLNKWILSIILGLEWIILSLINYF